MISFKQFLTEERIDQILAEGIVKRWVTTELSDSKAVKILNTDYLAGLNAISNGGVIYRGFSGDGDAILHINSADGKRTSRDTNNAYQLMMDTSTAMGKYPSRSKSFICTTSPMLAEAYGTAYVMVPKTGTKIAVAGSSDILDTTIASPIFSGDIADVSVLLSLVSPLGVTKNKTGQWTDGPALDSSLSKVSAAEVALIMAIGSGVRLKWNEPINISGDPEDYEVADYEVELLYTARLRKAAEVKRARALANIMIQRVAAGDYKTNPILTNLFKLISAEPVGKRFTANASAIMTPKNLGASMIKYGDSLPASKEVWFSGPAIAIPVRTFGDMVGQLAVAGFPISKRVSSHFEDDIRSAKNSAKYEAKLAAKAAARRADKS